MRLRSFLALALPSLLAAWLHLGQATAQDAAAAPGKVTFGYLGLTDDPRHAVRETYANLLLRPAVVPLDGALTAMRDARIMGRALKLEFALEAVGGQDLNTVAAGMDRLASEAGTRFFLVDLPGPMLAELVARTRGRELALLNVSAEDDELRGVGCAAQLLHVIPSQAMLSDALGQFLADKQWRNVLMLVGQTAEDETLAKSFEAGVTRFGARVVATRRFVAGRDPRQRELNNVRLLTQGADHDVVLVVDSDGELARALPYQTVLPRPVIGSHGLQPLAWHWAFERQGAPQLNQRFERQVGGKRRMSDPEWAAWAAIRSLLEAYTRARSPAFADVLAALAAETVTLDVYKGAPASFRAWDNQMRQPLFLATGDAVVARAPFERFLHERNSLDTLGIDAPQTKCRK